MRIFTAIRHSIDPKFYYGGLWSANFYPALQKLGHELIESKVDLLPASQWLDSADNLNADQLEVRSRITQGIIDEVVRAHNKEPIDLFLSYFYNSHFDPLGFQEFRRLGIPTVNFYCNSLYQFQLVADIAAHVDYSWHAEKDARDLYLRVNANPVWVQMAADPSMYRPYPELHRQKRACFVGQRYCDRDRWLAHLARSDVPVDIYGSGWSADDSPSFLELAQNYRNTENRAGSFNAYLRVTKKNIGSSGWISGARRTFWQGAYALQTRRLLPKLTPLFRGHAENVAEVFSRYELVLNFSNVWADGKSGSRLIPHVRLRDFEAPMSRCCYLTGYSEEIKEFYELGREIDTYDCPEELIAKSRYYLDNPAQAERLRTAGFKRAIRDHTWTSRFRELFQKLRLRRERGRLVRSLK